MDSTSGNEQVVNLLTALSWLVVVCVVAAVAGVVIYKRFSPKANPFEPPTTFSLADLRHMRDTDQITEEEFQRTRAMVIGESQDLVNTEDHSPPTDPQ